MTHPAKASLYIVKAIAAVAATVLIVAGCTSTSIDAAFPEASRPVDNAGQEQAAGEQASNDRPGPAETGDYPNLNIPAEAATEQRTSSETRERMSELKSLQRDRAKEETKNKIDSDEKRLRKLGREHGRDVLREIEAE